MGGCHLTMPILKSSYHSRNWLQEERHGTSDAAEWRRFASFLIHFRPCFTPLLSLLPSTNSLTGCARAARERPIFNDRITDDFLSRSEGSNIVYLCSLYALCQYLASSSNSLCRRSSELSRNILYLFSDRLISADTCFINDHFCCPPTLRL